MAGRVVSTRYVPVVITTPANTARSAPHSTLIMLGDVSLDEILLVVPPGHFGLTGIQFQYAQTPILPWNDPNGWIIGNDFRETFIIVFEVSSPLQALTYNLDGYDHSFYVYARVSDLAPPATSQTAIVPIS